MATALVGAVCRRMLRVCITWHSCGTDSAASVCRQVSLGALQVDVQSTPRCTGQQVAPCHWLVTCYNAHTLHLTVTTHNGNTQRSWCPFCSGPEWSPPGIDKGCNITPVSWCCGCRPQYWDANMACAMDRQALPSKPCGWGLGSSTQLHNSTLPHASCTSSTCRPPTSCSTALCVLSSSWRHPCGCR